MAISLLDIKNGQRVRRKDEEETIFSSIQPNITNSTQTISLKDIRDGKSSIKPLITTNQNEENINNQSSVKNITNDSVLPSFTQEAEKLKEQAIKKSTQSKAKTTTQETKNKETKEEKEYNKEVFKLAEKNLNEKEEKYDSALKAFQEKQSEEYKKSGIDFQTKFESTKGKKISYQTKEEDKLQTAPKMYDLTEVNKNIEKERKAVNDSLNDIVLAKHQYDSAKVATEDTTMFDKTIGVPIRAIKDLGSILNVDANKYVDENGNEYFLPTYNQLKQEKVSSDYNNKFTKFLGDVGYNTTKILGSTALNTITAGIGGTATYWTDMFTDNFKNVKNQGYDDTRAFANSLVSTGAEYLTGKLIGSATKGLTGGSTSEISNVISNATNKLVKNPQFSSLVGKAGSEGVEEFLQEYIDNINRLVTLENSTNIKDYVNIFKDKDILEEALYSAGVGAFSGGALGAVNNADGRVASQNTAIFTTFKNQLEEKKSTLTNPTEISKYNSAIQKIDNYINKPFTNNSESITNDIANTVNALNLGQNQTVTNKNIISNINNQNIGNYPNTGINNTKVDFISSAKQNNIDVNTETVKTINSKLLERGIKAKFDSNEFTNSNENAFWRVTKDENGNVTREVVFNPNAKTEDLLQNVAVHELYHDIANSKDGQKISKQLLDFASTKEGYAEARQSLEQLYAQKYDSKSKKFQTLVNEEAVASILGKKLGNQEFISQLTTEQPTLSRTVYNWVVDKLNKLNKLTGYKSEKLFWADVKNKFDNAYRSDYSNTNIKSKFSIKSDSNGNKYVNIDTSQDIFEGKSLPEQTKIARRYILDNFRKNGLLLGDEILNVTSKTANEYTHPKNQLPATTKESKMRASTELDNLIEISEFSHSSKDDGRHSFAKDGWDYYKTVFKVGDNVFTGLVNIGKFGNKKTLYDITNIKRISQNRSTSANAFSTSLANSIDDNISQNNESVKSDISSTKYSMQESTNNTQDNQGRKLSKEQQDFFKDSKVRDEEGNLEVVYHGTANDFTVFDISKSNDVALGNGLYFTNVESTADAYANNSETFGKVLEGYLDIKKPINSESKTISFDDFKSIYEALDKNSNLYDEEMGMSEIKSLLSDYGDIYNENMDSILRKYYDAYDNDVSLIDNLSYMSNVKELYETIRKTTKIDGIIVEHPSNFAPYEKYYIAFNSNQFKVINNTNPTTNEDIRYSQQANKWDEHLNQHYQTDGTGQTLSQVRNKVMNPLEIANLKPEDANTTPKLNNVKVETGNGKSSFYNNITNKTEMLSEENRAKLSTESDIEFYKEVTNKESLDEAYQRLNDGGASETLNWINKKSEQANATDIAEGWILLKQYQDAGDYDSMVQVAKKMREMGTKAGQTVQAFNIMSRLTPEGMVKYAQSELTEAYNIMLKNKTKEWINKNASNFDLTPQETQFIVDTMKEVATMEDGYNKKVKLAEIQKMLQDKLPPEKGAGIKSWMRISMLFNPKTQVRNVMGNAVIAPVNMVADAMSAFADKQVAKKTGVRTTGITNIKQYGKGFKEGVYQSYNDFKKGINTRDMQGNRFEIGQGKSFKNNNILGKSLNKIDSILNFALDVGDRPFYEAAFTNSINNQLVLNNTTEVTQDMIDIATQEALSRTWQDNNNYTKMVLNIRRNLNLNSNRYGLGDVLIPFAKTPANLTKAIVDYSPAGLVKAVIEGNNLKKSLSNGQYDIKQQHKFVQDLGKATAGTMLHVLGFALAKAKITSGENDEDKDVADFMKNTLGIQPYSIKIGNKSFTYDWAQPVAAPFAITANFINNTNEEAKLYEKLLSAMDAGFNLILEQSFMSSIQNVLSNIGGVPEGIMNQILDLPARSVPTFLKQVNDLIDGTTRTSFEKGEPVKTATNKVKSKVPGLSTGLAISRDSLGRKVEKYGGDNNIFNVFLNPANVNKGKESESAKEIYKVYQATGDKTVMPRVTPYSITLNGKTKTLSAEERSEFQKISGEIVEQNVKKLTTNNKYKKLSDEDKAEVIYGIVGYAYNKAKSEVLDTEVSTTYKTANKYVEKGGALYDFYADKVYRNRN